MAPVAQELMFAVRLRTISHYFGLFLMVLAVLNLVPLLVALLHGEIKAMTIFGSIVLALLTFGVLLKKIRPVGKMQKNEAMVLAALCFLVSPIIAAIPLVFDGLAPIDAWFETVSAITTTGLSVRSTVEDLSATLLFSRSWMQWYGGLGIVVLSLALVVQPGKATLRLGGLDAPGDLVGGTRAHARRVLVVYLTVTAIGYGLWLILGGAPWHGLLYAMSAISTGGFAPTDGSLADLGRVDLMWVVTAISVAGALPFVYFHRLWKEGASTLWKTDDLWLLLLFGGVSSLVLGGVMRFEGHAFDAILTHAPLMTFSASSTSGFSSLSSADFSAASQLVMITVMAIGGHAGSTAGGFKIIRLLILLGLILRTMRRLTTPPHAVVEQRTGGRTLSDSEIQDALMILLVFIGTVFVSWFCFMLYGYPAIPSLFEVVSATGTVGLSAGITAASLPDPLKVVLGIDMLLGRLEFVAWLVLLYPPTWFSRKRGPL